MFGQVQLSKNCRDGTFRGIRHFEIVHFLVELSVLKVEVKLELVSVQHQPCLVLFGWAFVSSCLDTSCQMNASKFTLLVHL